MPSNGSKRATRTDYIRNRRNIARLDKQGLWPVEIAKRLQINDATVYKHLRIMAAEQAGGSPPSAAASA